MQIEYLRYFADIAETGSISQSAVNCFISQQGLNRIIQVLENEFGAELIRRAGHGVELTPEGQELLKHVGPILEHYDLAKRSVRVGYATGLESYSPTLFLYFSDVAIKFFSSVQGIVYGDYPSVHVRSMRADELFSMLADESFDKESSLFAMCFIEGTEIDRKIREEGYSFLPLIETKCNVRVAKGTPLSYKKSISLEELSRYPLAFKSSDAYSRGIKDFFAKHGVEASFKAFLRIDDDEMVSEAIRDGYAIGFCTDLGASRVQTSGMAIVPLDPPIPLRFGIVSSPDVTLDPEAEELRSFLQKHYKKVRSLVF